VTWQDGGSTMFQYVVICCNNGTLDIGI